MGSRRSFSSLASVLSGFSGGSTSGKVSREALGLRVPMPNSTLGLLGKFPSSAGGLVGSFPEDDLGLGVALGGGGLEGGAEVRWREALFFCCSDPSLEVRLRRTNSGPWEGCAGMSGAVPGAGSGGPEKTSSWDSLPSGGGQGPTSEGPLQGS